MTDAPERIMAWGDRNEKWGTQWKCCPLAMQPTTAFKVSEYLRADIAAARIAALEADLARARERVEPLERDALKPAP